MVKRLEALSLFYCGFSKTYIRRELNIKPAKLNKWIYEDINDIKTKALLMYYTECTEEEISRALKVKIKVVKKWINDSFSEYKKLIYETYIARKATRSIFNQNPFDKNSIEYLRKQQRIFYELNCLRKNKSFGNRKNPYLMFKYLCNFIEFDTIAKEFPFENKSQKKEFIDKFTNELFSA